VCGLHAMGWMAILATLMQPPSSVSVNPIECALLKELQAGLSHAALQDVPTLRRMLGSAGERVRRGQPADQGLVRAEALLVESCARVEARRAALPQSAVLPELPIAERWDELRAAVAEHPVVIVAGETGSGKTTQLPKLALELGRGLAGTIACTQPRRIAALSMARRLREELRLGSADTRVGHKVRFDALCDSRTLIKFVTDGMLLAESRRDRDLLEYDTLIIDEAHERSLNIDFLLGYTKQLLRKRTDLKVIISSATLDVERFSDYFDAAPVVSVSGRTYPVELLYQTPEREHADLSHEVARAVDDLMSLGEPGDILVFLSGEADIRECSRVLTRRLSPERFEVLPLLARLPSEQQRRIFHPGARRRVILATNVAETSLTIPRIRYVVDSGVARLSRYSHRTGVQRLHIEPISQASANQRKGRCGRIAPGICIRLYDEQDFESREAFTPPEIKRTSLASVILSMDDLRLGSIDAFPFVEPPLPAMIREGYRELHELGAVDAKQRVTRLGRELARFPVEPRLARMLMAARENGALEELLTIVAALTVDDPRQRPIESRDEADALHARFACEKNDFSGLLALWAFWQEAKVTHRSRTRLRHFCHDNFLALRRLQEWHNVRDQLRALCREQKGSPTPQPTGKQVRAKRKPKRSLADSPQEERILKSLLVGLLSKVGCRTEEGDYRGAHGTRFRIHPGSGLAKKGTKPEWLVAAELVDTRRLYARCVARIDPLWLEPIAAHICRYSYGQPYWDEASGYVRAPENVLLYGLPLVEGRQRHFGPIDPPMARRIFIEDGLVEGKLRAPLGVIRENTELVAELRALQERLRRRDMLADNAVIAEFYDERLPADVCSVKSLQLWLNQTPPATLEALRLPRALLLAEAGAEQAEAADANFPVEVRIGDVKLPLSYCYDRALESDGITCTLPAEALPLLEGWQHDWLVPGALPDKVDALLRALPKRVRRVLVPVPRTVEQFLASKPDRLQSLQEALSGFIRREFSLMVTSDLWPETVPPHLLMRFCVVDENGHTLAAGRDLDMLRGQISDAEARATEHDETVPAVGTGGSRRATRRQRSRGGKPVGGATGSGARKEIPAPWQRTGMMTWDCGALPERVNVGSVAVPIYHYPALVDRGDAVDVQLFPHAGRARRQHRLGLLRLYLLALDKPLRALGSLKGISGQSATILAVIGGNTRQIVQDIAVCAVAAHTLDGRALPRDGETFAAPLAAAAAGLYATTRELTAAVDLALQRGGSCLLAVEQQRTPATAPACDDLAQQLRLLLGEGFVTRATAAALRRLPTYIQGIIVRLERLQYGAAKDLQRLAMLAPYRDRWLVIRDAIPESEDADAVAEYRWLLEEWRISLFAQELGTAVKVSAKRLEKVWGVGS
jgi:ATP-dependent helicase HrpA